MARAAAQYLVAALLALLSAQTAVPSRHLVSPAQIVWCADSEQQAAEQIRPIHADRRVPFTAVEYTSRIALQPHAAVLFQRPPPEVSLFV